MRHSLRTAVAVGLAAALAGCDWLSGGGGDDTGAGDPCTRNTDCPTGLVCAGGFCAGAGTVGADGPCSANRDCATGLYCSPVGTCQDAGDGAVGAACATGADCARELACESYGTSGTCQPGGDVELGAPCTATADCLVGLACGDDAVCERPIDAFPPFTGVACDPDESPFRAFWQLPRASRRLADFFRLPFPNDARVREDGTLDLSDFPRPGKTLLGVDLVALYADALSADFDGFSTIGAVTFRFSTEFDFDTVGANGANVRYVDITDPARPEFGSERGRTFFYDPGHGKFACQHTLQIANYADEPLRPGHTYAVFLTSSIRSTTGAAPVQEPDLAAVLGDAAPTEPELARAWTQYERFRTYLTRQSRPASDIAAVAVFTAQDAPRHAARLAAAVSAAPLPTLKDLTLCNGSAPSPCASDGSRACGDSAGSFWEIHGRYAVPNFQMGTLPYETPADGGAIAVDAQGAPVAQGTLDVCFALTIPKSAMPAGGWPLVVHAHGTGGSFKAAVGSGIAEALATATPAMATFTFDGVGHGARGGSSTRDPDSLVFNVINPRAARDNHLQGAVDVIQALRVAQVAPFDVAGAGTIDFDATRVTYFGHSQGANVGIPALAESDLAKAAILSGAGSVLIQGILTKTSPVNAKAGLQLLVGEPLGAGHPVMTLWQTFFDRVDPINYDRLLVREPPTGVASKHVLMTWSATDTFSPKATLGFTVRAMGLQAASPVLEDLGVAEDARPVTNDVTAGDGPRRTAAVFQYAADGYDGHFVSTRNTTAVADWIAFVTSLAQSGTPNVP